MFIHHVIHTIILNCVFLILKGMQLYIPYLLKCIYILEVTIRQLCSTLLNIHRLSKCGANCGDVLSGHFTFSKKERIKRKVCSFNNRCKSTIMCYPYIQSTCLVVSVTINTLSLVSLPSFYVPYNGCGVTAVAIECCSVY